MVKRNQKFFLNLKNFVPYDPISLQPFLQCSLTWTREADTGLVLILFIHLLESLEMFLLK